ncbi:PREDICTED: CD209 antigen-like protein A [Acropora digitifera]|uniref:CD209 antigen-like protein A n=1 Tax=Acropora digitifera TaxID=70779 RepID=UPI00077AB312|nr:PREDICTED: CD209 antigen-like protein A [Acropora digitifera]
MRLKDSIDRNRFITFPDLCPDGFVVHKKLCYYMNSTSTSSWGAARSLCQNMGADLVVIKSEEENQFVHYLMYKSGSDRGWIGIQRNAHDNLYWIDGSPAYGPNLTYTNWHSLQPDNYGNNEGCGEIYLSDGKWNDRVCSSKTKFVLCQKPAV